MGTDRSAVAPRSPLRRVIRLGLPFVVSAGLLAWLLSQLDLQVVLGRMTLRSAAVLIPALLVYGAITFYLEVQSLLRVFSSSERPIDSRTGAQVRASSYLFSVLHIAVGVGVMAVLLRRRTGLSLADSAGAVAFISALDLGILLTFGAIALIPEPLARAGLALLAVGAIAGGLALLRTPRNLGPLERVRALSLFRAPRTTPLRPIIELVGIRVVFVSTFLALGGAALLAFSVEAPFPSVVAGVIGVALVSALPIAISGLGTGQAAFVYMFRDFSDPETLLACSLALSAGLLALRGGIGLVFSRELTREAMDAAREVEL